MFPRNSAALLAGSLPPRRCPTAAQQYPAKPVRVTVPFAKQAGIKLE